MLPSRSLRLLNRPALYPILRGLATQTTSKPGMDATRFKRGPEDRRLHDFSVQTLDGSIVSLSEFRHAPVALIVNTASECVPDLLGLRGMSRITCADSCCTRDMACDRNYQELQQLYDKYKDNGFVVLVCLCVVVACMFWISSDIPRFISHHYPPLLRSRACRRFRATSSLARSH
jgi:hypothetical protein